MTTQTTPVQLITQGTREQAQEGVTIPRHPTSRPRSSWFGSDGGADATKRVPPSVRMKEEVEALLRGEAQADVGAAVPMDGCVRGTARYMLQVAIEAEATAFLGRGHYRCGERTRVGWRNGYEWKGV